MTLKKLVYSAFVAFWTCVLTIIVLNSLSTSRDRAPESDSLPSYSPE